MWKAPIVQETRRPRQEYSARFNGDSDAIFQDILMRQAVHKNRLVSFEPRRPCQWKEIGERK